MGAIMVIFDIYAWYAAAIEFTATWNDEKIRIYAGFNSFNQSQYRKFDTSYLFQAQTARFQWLAPYKTLKFDPCILNFTQNQKLLTRKI